MLCPFSPSWGINCLFLRILLPRHHWPSAHKNKQENDFCASVEPSQQWHLWCVLLDLFGPWCHIPLWCTGLIRRNGYLSIKIIILIYPMHCGASVGGGGGSKFFLFFLAWEGAQPHMCQTNAFHTKHSKPKLLALINSTHCSDGALFLFCFA